MKKVIPLSIIIVLLISGLGAAAYQHNDTVQQQTETIEFSSPEVKETNQFLTLSITETNSCVMQPGQPILPTYTTTMTFPWGTKITDVNIDIPTIITQEKLNKKIIPAPAPVTPDALQRDLNEQYLVYPDTEELYPDTWYTFWTGSGLYKDELDIILTIEYYPVRYSSALDTLYFTPKAEITVSYEEPTAPITFADTYELLIITPASYTSAVQPLADHKEAREIATKIVTLEEIYGGDIFPVEGDDDAEQVKYFIKNAFDEWGIKYVLLAGGRKPGEPESWHVPVRYVNIFWANEPRYMSDLYFADLYDAEMNFSSWDTDENGVYGEWKATGDLLDDMDLYPEVLVGRLPARCKLELRLIVNKIIRTEKKELSDRVILVGGDNFQEGPEITCAS